MHPHSQYFPQRFKAIKHTSDRKIIPRANQAGRFWPCKSLRLKRLAVWNDVRDPDIHGSWNLERGVVHGQVWFVECWSYHVWAARWDSSFQRKRQSRPQKQHRKRRLWIWLRRENQPYLRKFAYLIAKEVSARKNRMARVFRSCFHKKRTSPLSETYRTVSPWHLRSCLTSRLFSTPRTSPIKTSNATSKVSNSTS